MAPKRRQSSMTWGRSNLWIKTFPRGQHGSGLLLHSGWAQSVPRPRLGSVQRYDVRYPAVNSRHRCFGAASTGHHPRVCVGRVWGRVRRRLIVSEAAGWDQAAAAASIAHAIGRRRRGTWLVEEQLGGWRGGAVGQEAVEKELVVLRGRGSRRRCHDHVVMLQWGETRDSTCENPVSLIVSGWQQKSLTLIWRNESSRRLHDPISLLHQATFIWEIFFVLMTPYIAGRE